MSSSSSLLFHSVLAEENRRCNKVRQSGSECARAERKKSEAETMTRRRRGCLPRLMGTSASPPLTSSPSPNADARNTPPSGVRLARLVSLFVAFEDQSILTLEDTVLRCVLYPAQMFMCVCVYVHWVCVWPVCEACTCCVYMCVYMYRLCCVVCVHMCKGVLGVRNRQQSFMIRCLREDGEN